jgi:hypothetical protein
MPKKRDTSEQRDLFNPQPSLFEEEEEELSDKVRRFLRHIRQYRERIFKQKEQGPQDPPTSHI